MHGGEGAWKLGPELAGAGVGIEELTLVAGTVDSPALSAALRWLTCTVQTKTLLSEITDATGRISALVDAAKQYSQMDRGAHQNVDVHDGLDSTLVMLATRLATVSGWSLTTTATCRRSRLMPPSSTRCGPI